MAKQRHWDKVERCSMGGGSWELTDGDDDESNIRKLHGREEPVVVGLNCRCASADTVGTCRPHLRPRVPPLFQRQAVVGSLRYAGGLKRGSIK